MEVCDGWSRPSPRVEALAREIEVELGARLKAAAELEQVTSQKSDAWEGCTRDKASSYPDRQGANTAGAPI